MIEHRASEGQRSAINQRKPRFSNEHNSFSLIGGECCEVHEAWLILMLQNLTYRLFDEDVPELNELFIKINIFI